MTNQNEKLNDSAKSVFRLIIIGCIYNLIDL